MEQPEKKYVAVGLRLNLDTARKLRMYAAGRMVPMSAVVVELIDGLLYGPVEDDGDGDDEAAE